ncbi:MAG: Carnitine monooxygenase oxygenase subunit [Deltaproteobacteria bacterium]|jgi:choline monooxygenase|nr:Carnitine monooxygenase oxygenase subunit [Deltaproteobacteria bacterium]
MNSFNQQRLPTESFTKPETYNLSRLPVDQASTLIPDAYTAPDFFALEQEKVFAMGWVAVGCLPQVSKPGDILVTDVAGRSILVVRDKKSKLGAFYNVCRHRGSKLLFESCNSKSIRCPYHAWVYGLDGKCLGTPMFKNEKTVGAVTEMLDAGQFDKRDYGLYPIAVRSWGFLVFVNLSAEAADDATETDVSSGFEEWLGDLPEKFQSHGLEHWTIASQKNYDVASNYKLVAENFMEYYHLPFVHPELSNVSRIEDHHRCQGPGMYTGMLTTPVSRDVDSVWLNLPAAEGLEEQHQQAAYHIWIFPNVAITLLPNHAFCLITDPINADQTLERTFLLIPPGTLDNEWHQAMFGELVTFWDMVNTQDLGIVERVQAGLSNTAFQGGRMCYHFEEPLHRYHNWVADRMCGIHRVPPGDEDLPQTN